jgi:hypothetical protein
VDDLNWYIQRTIDSYNRNWSAAARADAATDAAGAKQDAETEAAIGPRDGAADEPSDARHDEVALGDHLVHIEAAVGVGGVVHPRGLLLALRPTNVTERLLCWVDVA